MEFVTIMKAKKALCYSVPEKFGSCPGCPIEEAARSINMSCGKFEEEYPEQVETIVIDWMNSQN